VRYVVASLYFSLFLGTLVIFGQWDSVTAAGTKVSFRGVHNPGGGVFWVSGSGGTVLRSVDKGSHWQQCTVPPDAGKLDFRGVWGFGKGRAIVMSSGPGNASRLYETSDACRSWRLLLTNPDPAGFWDAIGFYRQTGVLLGDPVNGSFVVYKTDDGGRHWKREKSASLAASPKGEGAFAASNSALVVQPGGKKIFFGTGGPGGSRIFMLDLKVGGNWTVANLPWKVKSESSGIFSLAFRDREHGVAVGGDYKNPANRDSTAAFTVDGGMTWQPSVVSPGGYRSSVQYDSKTRTWITVGSNGSDISRDDGRTWQHLDNAGWNALGLPWAVGSNGRIARLENAIPHVKP
jgi:photosystem II stability/assembly factor-like uncharacterized protein